MKASRSHKASAFGQPTVRGWLVVFVSGFLTVCILGAALFFVAWLVRKGAAGLKMPVHGFPFEPPELAAAHVVLKSAAIFGVLLATLSLYQSARRKRQEERLPGTHAILGDYESVPHFKTWHSTPLLPTGREVSLNGCGDGPSEIQVAQWQQFISRYENLVAAAEAGLLTPPHPLQECRAVTLTPKAISLSHDGRVKIAFQFFTEPENSWSSDEEKPFPLAVFSPTLELENTDWVTAEG
ncbi:hypothetical protein [Prosthecobacter sp.]|uniref:hypothetical protein n=1 Tax=Prosthecobacter sp. TaxID=1965333 RepID=UPI00378433F2